MKYIVLVMIVIFYSGCTYKEKYTFYSTKTLDFTPIVKIVKLDNENNNVKGFFGKIGSSGDTNFIERPFISSYEHINNLLEDEDALFYSSSMTPKRKHFRNKRSPWIRQQSYLWRYDDRK